MNSSIVQNGSKLYGLEFRRVLFGSKCSKVFLCIFITCFCLKEEEH